MQKVALKRRNGLKTSQTTLQFTLLIRTHLLGY